LSAVDAPRLFSTASAPPQLEFWELDDERWHKITPRPYERRPLSDTIPAQQLALPAAGSG
jgi:hypothetical protein